MRCDKLETQQKAEIENRRSLVMKEWKRTFKPPEDKEVSNSDGLYTNKVTMTCI